jgi:glyoxylase-like metal-dependent hydrolase (beta-lactamase superfamily II)/rhodanese-related sulfurtransferase
MAIRELSGGDCKTWLYVAEKTREAVVVDPLLEKAQALLDLLRSEGLKPVLAVDTHVHADHLSGARWLSEKAGIPVGMHESTRVGVVTRRLKEGETLAFGELALTVLHTPGHTTDSLSLAGAGAVATGDFLFLGALGAGRLDLPGGDAASHFRSLAKIADLSGSWEVLPGHDYQGRQRSTLAAERRENPVLSPRGLEQYRAWWEARKLGPADWMKAVVAANLEGRLDAAGVVIPKGVSACASGGTCAPVPVHGDAAMPHLDARDLAKMLAERRDLTLLDCREPEEYGDELGHIAGTVLIPVGAVAERAAEVPSDKPIVSICRSGKRALRAALALKAAGRKDVWVLTGGMLAWNEAKLPVER